MGDSIVEKIEKLFDPLLNLTTKQYDNNYMLYAILIMFLLILLLIAYMIFKGFGVI